MATTDPLGALTPVMDVSNLPRWNTGDVPAYDIMVEDPDNMRRSPFEWRDDINQKVLLW